MKPLILLFLSISFYCQSMAQPKYEFRAAWIATVDNIDWPSRGNLSSDSQRAEFINMLDMHQRNGLNAVVVQVRPATDAFYPSQYEPWSQWLTGKQGQPPVPYYDPLQFMIEETHKRGMEFHAWCNPYRAVFSIAQSSIAPSHITRVHPEWFLSYGGTRYFDPGNKDVQRYVTLVIRDIVKRYDIDAIHFDDYFYPYRIAGKEFPDAESYANSGTTLSKEDWRRSNVDSIILSLGKAIKEEKKYCKFGISPFGVWRNKDKDAEGSDTRAGQTNYDDLYANILLWLKNGWIDYVAPQLYWEFGHRAAPFEVLLDWWNKHAYGRHCYIGLGMFKAGSNPAWRDRSQMPRQIQAIRGEDSVQGEIYFSGKTFQGNPNGWCDSLQANYYRVPALLPPMNWIDSLKPPAPKLTVNSITDLSFVINADYQTAGAPRIKSVVFYRFPNDKDTSISTQANIYSINEVNDRAVDRPDVIGTIIFDESFMQSTTQLVFAATAIGEHNTESARSNLIRLEKNADGKWHQVR